MPNIAPLQDDFSAGEISPRLRGKTSSPFYQQGLAYCENFEVTPQGSLQMRAGTEHIIDIANTESEGVLHTFRRGLDNDAIIFIGDQNITAYNRDGVINQTITDPSNNLMRDPTFLAGFQEYQIDDPYPDNTETSTVNGSSATLYLQNAIIALQGMSVSMQQLNIAVVAGEPHLFDTRVSLALDYYTSFNVSPNTEAKFSVSVSESGGGITHFTEEIIIPIGDAPISNVILELTDKAFTPAASSINVTYYMQVANTVVDTLLNAKFTAVIDGRKQSVRNVSSGVSNPVTFPTPNSWKNNANNPNRLRSVQSCVDSATGDMFFSCLNGQLKRLSYVSGRVPDEWIFEDWITGIDPPWQGGATIANEDYPSTCAIHQGRLWLGGSKREPSTLWASAVFNYDDFTPASGALTFTLTSNGAIQWLSALKNLLIGTDQGLVIGRSASGGTAPITEDNFSFPTEQVWGTARITPAQNGDRIMLATSDLSKIRSLFDGGDSRNGYDSMETSFFAEHLTRNRIIDVMYAANPRYQLSCLLSDRTIASSTYFEGVNINAWYRMTTSDPIESITDSNDIIGTSGWYLVRRNNGLALEVKNASESLGYNADSYIIAIADGNGVVNGLDHLNGYDCAVIIISGATRSVPTGYSLHPNRTPVNGSIQLNDYGAGKSVVVGIPYTATAVTLPLEGANPQGTSQVQKRRFNEVFMRVYDSAIPQVNGVRPPLRAASTDMTTSTPMYTGDMSINQAGWNDGVLTIEQDLPLPTNITAVFGKAKGSAV